jgi:hypothetical protein
MLRAHRRLASLPALGLLLLAAACGSKSTPAPGPLELACAVDSAGNQLVLTVLGRATTSAAATSPAITVTLQTFPTPVTFTLSGPGWTGSAEFRLGSLSAGTWLEGTATIDGVPASTSCLVASGLPAFAAQLTRTPDGASLAWGAVAGAVGYRWTLRDGLGGAAVASGHTLTPGASVVMALDPASTWIAEVAASSLTGAETSFPSPLPSPRAAHARVGFSAGSGGGDGQSAWQLFTPGDYLAGTLTVAYPNLLAGERLMVLLLNAGGQDRSAATVTVVGTGLPALASVTPSGALATGRPATPAAASTDRLDRAGALGGEVLVTALREETARRRRNGELQRVVPAAAARAMGATGPAAALAPLPLPVNRSFCQFRYTDTSVNPISIWLPATLAYQTPNAAFYYTNEVKAGIDLAIASRAADPTLPAGVAPFWGELGASFESKILPALTRYFGTPSDVDGNGKVVFLLANLGKQGSSYVAGLFWDGDIDLPQSDATSCPRGAAGNQTDMLYLMDPANFITFSGSTNAYDVGLKSLVEADYPNVMAHELQHDVSYITRCPLGTPCGVPEALWLNEGLSMLSETVAGYGLHEAGSRADVRSYQGEVEARSGLPYHRAYSLTTWERSPYGNYAGVQAYMQYLLDHASPTMTRALENPRLAGKANIEAATGLPWEIGFARFVTAAVFSNEDQAEPNGGAGPITSAGNQLAQPILNYLGDTVAPDYVPWHRYTGFCTAPDGVRHDKARTARVAYVPLASTATVPLRTDGWTALATGAGAGSPATISVQSTASVKPHVVVVKYTGALPNYVSPNASEPCP